MNSKYQSLVANTIQLERRLGLSMVECVLATAMVGVLLATSMSALAVVSQGKFSGLETDLATRALQSIAAEVMAKAFEDPQSSNAALGVDAGESSRELWDDCDDYAGWSTSALQSHAGEVIPELSGWDLEVKVAFCQPGDLVESVARTELKRITLQLVSPGGQRFICYLFKPRHGPLQHTWRKGGPLPGAFMIHLENSHVCSAAARSLGGSTIQPD